VTERNRLKRLARECFRRLRRTLPPCDYLVYFFAAALEAEPGELRAALTAAFARLAGPRGR